jgi:hypothetical protein
MVFRSDKHVMQSVDIKNLQFGLKQNVLRHHKKSDGNFLALAFAFGFCSGMLLSVLELQWLPDAFTTLKSKLVY